MKVKSAAANLLCASALFLATAQAQRPTQTTHVPAAVLTGIAPLVGHVPSDQRLSLAVSLPLRNQAELEDLLQRLYDPQSPSFHQYLSVQEFTARFGPTEADYAAAINFARANGLDIIDTPANRLVLDIEGPAANVEKAFNVTLNQYQHPTESRTFFAPDREPSLDLAAPVLHISGLDNFTLPRAKNIRSSQRTAEASAVGKTGSGPGGQYVASDMREAYYGSGPLTGQGQTVGLFEFAGYNTADVKAYFKNLKQTITVKVKGVSLNGISLKCPPSTCDDSEQVIDIEMAIGMAPGLKEVLVYVGRKDASIFNQMAVDNTAKTLSCSWGWTDNESTLDPIFMEMAMQGQSVFVATGDSGSGTPGDVVWPADDPYITAVGGTDINTVSPGGAWKSETGWSGSAGSPSKNGIAIPSYQQLAGVITAQNHASKTLRNYPDVVAEANTNQYSCYDSGCSGGNGGTSFAAPQWASFIAMANEQSLSNGGSTLGFLNPAIYALGVGSTYDADFHDITSGSNGGYTAVSAYDLVTGWGSPQGAALIDALAGSGKSAY